MSELSKKPIPIYQVGPEWPFGNLDVRHSVSVQFIVRSDGSVDDLQVISSSSDLATEATLKAIEKWRFSPGEIDGTPVDCFANVRIPFYTE
jgi:TonB family protein